MHSPCLLKNCRQIKELEMSSKKLSNADPAWTSYRSTDNHTRNQSTTEPWCRKKATQSILKKNVKVGTLVFCTYNRGRRSYCRRLLPRCSCRSCCWASKLSSATDKILSMQTLHSQICRMVRSCIVLLLTWQIGQRLTLRPWVYPVSERLWLMTLASENPPDWF